MKRNLLTRFACLALFLVLAGSILQTSIHAQSPVTVQATPFHRFLVTYQSLGHFLTANFSEGSGNPYNYAYQPFPYQADIVVCPSGYTPAPGQGLLALHRWQVDQRPRIYYYYSVYYSNLGSNYHYQGIAGYVLPADGSFGGTPLNFWYSQQYGYYFTLNGEYPSCCSFSYQGVPFNLPQGGTYTCNPIPPPPDPCPGFEQQRDDCLVQGGNWNDNGCFCEMNNECPPRQICYNYTPGEAQPPAPEEPPQ